jgi:hypothetical protein
MTEKPAKLIELATDVATPTDRFDETARFFGLLSRYLSAEDFYDDEK